MNLSQPLRVELPAMADAPSAHPSRLRLMRDGAICAAGFAVYGALATGVTVGCLLAALETRGTARKRVCQQLIHCGVRAWAAVMEKLGVYHVDFPAEEVAALQALRGAVIAPNHPCLFDATLFLARLPRLTCLMKRSIVRNPFMGGSSSLAGYLPNAHGAAFIRQGRDALLAGENLLIFPEGTRTVQAPVNPFRKGFALIASLADAPVQTVFIQMSVPYLGKRWPLYRVPVLPIQVRVRLGRQFQPGEAADAKAFGAEIEAYFRSSLAE
jgi:hypothetical protein